MGVFTPGTPLANDAGMEAITAPRDLERSRRELREAGYNGERVVVLAPSDQPALAALGEVGADLLRKLGVEVDHRVSDWGTLVQRRSSREPPERGGWSMFHTTWNGLDGINPGVMTFLRANGPNAWFGWPDAPKLEALRQSWFDAPDPETRSASLPPSRPRRWKARPTCRPGSTSAPPLTGGRSPSGFGGVRLLGRAAG